MRRAFVLLFSLAMPLLAFCQDTDEPEPQPRKAPPAVPAMQSPVRVPTKLKLAAGTEIWLRLGEDVKVKKVKAGDTVHFVLYHDLYYRDALLAKAGTPVDADIKEAVGAKMVNRGSNLVISIHGLTLLNGQTVPLDGEASYRGGRGVGGQIASGILDPVGHCNAAPCLIYDVPAIPIAGLVALFTHGENKNAKINATGVAYVEHDFDLTLAALPPATDPPAMAQVRILRGNEGWPYSRDLYCNGIPLAHLPSGKILDLKLKPGDYRFAIDPKKRFLELFVPPGATINLLTDYMYVDYLRENEVSLNTHARFGGKKTAGEMLKKSKPVEQKDIYATDCQPLPTQSE